jgi:hypothetical protein
MAKKVPAKKVASKKADDKPAAAKKTPVKKGTPKGAAKKSSSKTSGAKPSGKKTSSEKTPTGTLAASATNRTVKGKRKAALQPQAKTTRRPKAKGAANRTAAVATEGYLATLNDWRQDAVARLRRMIQRPAPQSAETPAESPAAEESHGPLNWIKTRAKGVNLRFLRSVELPNPRKVLVGARGTVRQINFGRLKDAGKKELEELARLVSKLNEARRGAAPKK